MPENSDVSQLNRIAEALENLGAQGTGVRLRD